MLEWIDRDTFKIDGRLRIINYNNVISISVYNYPSDKKTKLVMKTCTGEEISLVSCETNDTEKVKKIEDNFVKFYKSRPGNNESDKIKIK